MDVVCAWDDAWVRVFASHSLFTSSRPRAYLRQSPDTHSNHQPLATAQRAPCTSALSAGLSVQVISLLGARGLQSQDLALPL